MANSDQRNWMVIDLGGSIIAPQGGLDSNFLQQLQLFFSTWLDVEAQRSLALVVGGGAVARFYQQTLTQLNPQSCYDSLDWLGIRATHLNASLVQGLFSNYQAAPIISNYDNLNANLREQRLLVGGGWKPGFSTDYDSVLLAMHLQVKRLLCLSNLAYIYSSDPKLDASAQPFERLSWSQYQSLIGDDDWRPGRSLPFDPLAAKLAATLGMEVVFVDGRNLDNFAQYLAGAPFIGTVISS